MRNYLFLLILLVFIQCSTPKDACIDITSIDQKHEQLSKQLGKRGFLKGRKIAVDENQLNGVLLKSHGPFGANTGNVEVDLNPDFETDFLASSLVSKELTGNEKDKKVQQRIKKLKNYLDEHYFGMDTVLTDTSRVSHSVKVDLFEEQHRKAKKQAIASFVLFWTSLIPGIGILSFIASIVFGFRSLKSYRKTFNKQGRGWAIASLVLSGITLAALILLVFLAIIFFSQGGWMT